MKIKPLEWFEFEVRGVVEFSASVRDFNIKFHHVEGNRWFFTWTAGEWDGHFDTDSQYVLDDLNYNKMKDRCQEEYEKWLKHAYGIED